MAVSCDNKYQLFVANQLFVDCFKHFYNHDFKAVTRNLLEVFFRPFRPSPFFPFPNVFPPPTNGLLKSS